MKTTSINQDNKLANQVSSMQNSNELWFYKRTHILATISNFIGFVCAAIAAIVYFGDQEYASAALSFAVFIFCASNFLQEGIYYTIQLPTTYSKKLFKIGDVYFAGANVREAELYAHINKLDAEIECISTNCNLF
jgi:hypothetical protein